jgi:hypothetical protein
MSDKPLSYISQISELIPITGKDRIVLASFSNNSWKVIVNKDDFSVGDKCIYIETDSILPIKPEFQFLEKRCFSSKYKGYRIKTMKMGDVYSEGIAFTLDQLHIDNKLSVDTDLTEKLEIRRIEDDIPKFMIKKPAYQRFFEKWIYRIFRIKLKRKGIGVWDFPTNIIPKTDETQVQSLKYVFGKLQNLPIYASIKIDGQSATYILSKGEFSISSRNRTVYKAPVKKAVRDLTEKKAKNLINISSHIYCAAKYNIPFNMLITCQELGIHNLALQGEVAGPGIQKNRLGLEDFELFIFSAYDINERKFFTLKTLEFICNRSFLQLVPIIKGVSTFSWKNIDELTSWTEQFTYRNGSPAEGAVIRANPSEKYMPVAMEKMNAMLSFKCINPKFKIATQKDE